MGIDGIGKPPSIPEAGGPGGAAPVASTGRAFEVEGTAETAPSGDLARLERGEIELSTYLDARVEEATRHLTASLSPAQLEFVKQTLRTELEGDPVLVELVRRATGKVPSGAQT
jgi:hypothetical protein